LLLEKVESDDVLLCCISATAADIFNTRRDEGYCCGLIGIYLM
jgi:hypothetical protein